MLLGRILSVAAPCPLILPPYSLVYIFEDCYILKLHSIYLLYLKNKTKPWHQKVLFHRCEKGSNSRILYFINLCYTADRPTAEVQRPPPIHYKFGPEGCKVQRYYDKKYKDECPFFQVWNLKYNFSNILYIPTNKSKIKYLISLLKLSNIVKSSKSLKDKFILFDDKTTS